MGLFAVAISGPRHKGRIWTLTHTFPDRRQEVTSNGTTARPWVLGHERDPELQNTQWVISTKPEELVCVCWGWGGHSLKDWDFLTGLQCDEAGHSPHLQRILQNISPNSSSSLFLAGVFLTCVPHFSNPDLVMCSFNAFRIPSRKCAFCFEPMEHGSMLAAPTGVVSHDFSHSVRY